MPRLRFVPQAPTSPNEREATTEFFFLNLGYSLEKLYSADGALERGGPAGGEQSLTLAEISEPESTCVSAIV